MAKPVVCSALGSLAGALLVSLVSGGCNDDSDTNADATRSGAAGTASSSSGASGAGGSKLAGVGGLAGQSGAVAVSGSSAMSAGSGGATAAGSAGEAGMGGDAANLTSNGCIVPLYSYPSDSAWNAIVQAKQAHAAVDVVAIVNPASGPGDDVDDAYVAGIAKLVAAGIVPIGYVSTSYTERGQTAVNADTDTWRASYPDVQGIFFDEQSVEPGDETFYAAVTAHAKSQGFTLTVGNPGTNPPNSFLSAVDVMLSYESAGTPALTNLEKYAAHREQFGIIPYAVDFDASYVEAASQSVRYVYLTDDDLPNPWDSLPSYFDALLGALAP